MRRLRSSFCARSASTPASRAHAICARLRARATPWRRQVRRTPVMPWNARPGWLADSCRIVAYNARCELSLLADPTAGAALERARAYDGYPRARAGSRAWLPGRAGDGDRTHIIGLEGRCSTIELRPQRLNRSAAGTPSERRKHVQRLSWDHRLLVTLLQPGRELLVVDGDGTAARLAVESVEGSHLQTRARASGLAPGALATARVADGDEVAFLQLVVEE